MMAVYLAAVLSCALSQAFSGFGEWWEPLVVPVALSALVLSRCRVLVVILVVAGLVLWRIYR